jgi:hypothetical protein
LGTEEIEGVETGGTDGLLFITFILITLNQIAKYIAIS